MRFLVTAVIAALCCLSVRSDEKVFIVNDPNENRTVVIVEWTEESENEQPAWRCEMFTDQSLVEKVLAASKPFRPPIRTPTKEEMKYILEECTAFSLRKRRQVDEEQWNDEDEYHPLMEEDYYDEEEEEVGPGIVGRRKASTTPSPQATSWNIIFPGTKWCGAGDVAKHDDDLGFHQDTDRCCRAHDKCDDLILAGETKYNLTNKSPFTKLSCKCDNDFYDCLSRVNSVTSNTIGNTYFNVLRRPCYKEDYPLTNKCKKYKTFLKLRCAQYERDTSSPKVYEWKPAKVYKKIPFPGPLTFTLPF